MRDRQPARKFQLRADRTPDDFVFDVKAYGELTGHHRDENGEMARPMRDAGKLGALLFPWAGVLRGG